TADRRTGHNGHMQPRPGPPRGRRSREATFHQRRPPLPLGQRTRLRRAVRCSWRVVLLAPLSVLSTQLTLLLFLVARALAGHLATEPGWHVAWRETRGRLGSGLLRGRRLFHDRTEDLVEVHVLHLTHGVDLLEPGDLAHPTGVLTQASHHGLHRSEALHEVGHVFHLTAGPTRHPLLTALALHQVRSASLFLRHRFDHGADAHQLVVVDVDVLGHTAEERHALEEVAERAH